MRSRASVLTTSRISRCSSVRGSHGTRESLLGGVADGLDVVALGIEDERAVVRLVVMRPEPRRAVVRAARSEGRLVEGIYRGAVSRAERDVRGARLAALR